MWSDNSKMLTTTSCKSQTSHCFFYFSYLFACLLCSDAEEKTATILGGDGSQELEDESEDMEPAGPPFGIVLNGHSLVSPEIESPLLRVHELMN